MPLCKDMRNWGQAHTEHLVFSRNYGAFILCNQLLYFYDIATNLVSFTVSIGELENRNLVMFRFWLINTAVVKTWVGSRRNWFSPEHLNALRKFSDVLINSLKECLTLQHYIIHPLPPPKLQNLFQGKISEFNTTTVYMIIGDSGSNMIV